jgi:lipopolysaccharide transport system permease protein
LPITIKTLVAPLRVFTREQQLTNSLAIHEIRGKYSSGIYSIIWILATPLVTLSVYTFIFGYVLKSSFHGLQSAKSMGTYGLGLFTGLVLWDFFSSVLSQSPYAITSKPNYVKKIVFPLNILPLVLTSVALFHFLVNFCVLLLGVLLIGTQPAWRIMVIPLLLAPILFYTAGLSWFLASIGVYFRDLGNAIPPFLQLLWFGSAIFFPIESVPAQFRFLFYINPISAMVDTARNYAILGQSLNVPIIFYHLLAGWVTACTGLYFFDKTKAGFADVL